MIDAMEIRRGFNASIFVLSRSHTPNPYMMMERTTPTVAEHVITELTASIQSPLRLLPDLRL